MTTTYYVPKELIKGNLVSLSAEEAHHAIQVLRRKEGDEINVIDGEGGWYRVCLTSVARKMAEGQVIEKRLNVGEPEFGLTVGMAILKNQKRFDTFVEKAVELGVTRIIPMITSRAERKTLKMDRLKKILIAAMKQCGRSKLISLEAITPLSQIDIDSSSELVLCCHEKAEPGDVLVDKLLNWKKKKEAIVLIGPEGGFTDEEISSIRTKAHIVSLGKRRLRAETAAIVAVSAVSLVWK